MEPTHLHVDPLFLLQEMVRHYKKKKQDKYTPEQLLAAVEAVREKGMKISQASQRFNVPYSTLRDHVKEKVSRIGAGSPTLLCKAEEK